jgi:hypothetical protein
MSQFVRIAALVAIVAATSMAWLILAGIMSDRSSTQDGRLSTEVAELWGAPLVQWAPALAFERQEWRDEVQPARLPNGQPMLDPNGQPVQETVRVPHVVEEPVALDSTDATANMSLDQRRKGLIWFSLYDLAFDARYAYVHDDDRAGTLILRFHFPQADGFYDDFHLTIDGQERWDAVPTNGVVEVRLPVEARQTVSFGIAYRTRGRDSFMYRPVPDASVGQVKDLSLTMSTDFGGFDFPPGAMSPTTRTQQAGKHHLTWDFDRLITGRAIGLSTPQHIQAGPLAAAMSLSAPLSLALYTMWIYVLGLLKRIDIHPMNHLMLAAAFFAFHLLFSYTADHLAVEVAFGLSAAVSLVLTTTYLRLVAGARFAMIEAGLAQILYLFGFSLAHFFEGWTGLTVTVLGIATLFAMMQLTGRIRWSEVFSGVGWPAQEQPAG